ncbi:MAG: hypothetical protein R3C01_09615 [Planctomycetaceae bacterium]
MNVATYNMRKGGSTRSHWQRMIEDHHVDLLFVQESYPHEEHLPPLLFPALRDRSVWANASQNKWGSGLFSASGTLTPLPLPNYQGWVAGAVIREPKWLSDGESILAFSIHAPAGAGSYPGQVSRILDEIRSVADGKNIIIAGDFNLTISDSAISKRPIQKNNREIQRRLAEEFGLINCWTEANPNQELAQTLRWTKDSSIPYHCDGIFVPRSWGPRLQSCVVLSGDHWDGLSDHNPVIACFGDNS